MKEVKFKPTASVIINMAAGVEVNAIVDERGTMYVPAFTLPDVKMSGASSSAPAKAAVETAVEKPVATEKAANVEIYSEEEMMNMETKELEVFCKKNGIKVPEDGKNTNKKLRLLILEWYDAKGLTGSPKAKVEEDEDEEEEDEKPKVKSPKGETIEDWSDLEKGDEVSVFWADEFNSWFNGHVSKIKEGKIYIKYEDGTEEALSKGITTKVVKTAGVEV